MSQPTEPVTQNCPNCHHEVTGVPYDIGSGPEMACPNCKWCWGAQGQVLLALEVSDGLPPVPALTFVEPSECGP